MKERRPSRLIYWFYGFVGLIGIGIICWRWAVLNGQKASNQWPTVSGTILHSERTATPATRGYIYRADVQYRYEVNGTRYLSRQICLWSADLSSYNSQAFISSHPREATVTVYYDPKEPGNAVLLPGANKKRNEMAMALGGLVILAAGVGIFRRLRRGPKLYAALNAPDAESRTIELRKADIGKGINVFGIHAICAGILLAAGFIISLAAISGASYTLEEPRAFDSWWFMIFGVVCWLVSGLFLARALKLSRSAQCPLCGAVFTRSVFETGECPGCGTRIIFPDAPRRPAKRSAARGGGGVAPSVIVTFQQGRFVDVVGFAAFPLVLAWLWAGGEKQFDWALAILGTIVPAACAAIYYVFPQIDEDEDNDKDEGDTDKAGGDDPAKKESETPEVMARPSAYLVDFSIILSPAVALTAYLLYLVWQHQALDKRGLAGAAIGFPVGIGIITLICYLRFTHAAKLKKAKLPGFVGVTLIALWLVGTFISIVLLVWWLAKLKG